MHYRSYRHLLRRLSPEARRGPLALVLVQDDLDVAGTLHHCVRAGLRHVIVLGPDAPPPGPCSGSAPADVHAPGARERATAALIRAAPGAWVVPLWNGERVVWPFAATRPLPALLSFLEEERRDTLGGVELDTYPGPDGTWHVDVMGYRRDGTGAIHGGLRDRIGPPCPAAGRRIDRPVALRRAPDPRGPSDGDALHGPAHHGPTAALLSPRVIAWLAAQPGHALRTTPRLWAGSAAPGTPDDLMQRGLIEPGQWV